MKNQYPPLHSINLWIIAVWFPEKKPHPVVY